MAVEEVKEDDVWEINVGQLWVCKFPQSEPMVGRNLLNDTPWDITRCFLRDKGRRLGRICKNLSDLKKGMAVRFLYKNGERLKEDLIIEGTTNETRTRILALSLDYPGSSGSIVHGNIVDRKVIILGDASTSEPADPENRQRIVTWDEIQEGAIVYHQQCWQSKGLRIKIEKKEENFARTDRNMLVGRAEVEMGLWYLASFAPKDLLTTANPKSVEALEKTTLCMRCKSRPEEKPGTAICHPCGDEFTAFKQSDLDREYHESRKDIDAILSDWARREGNATVLSSSAGRLQGLVAKYPCRRIPAIK